MVRALASIWKVRRFDSHEIFYLSKLTQFSQGSAQGSVQCCVHKLTCTRQGAQARLHLEGSILVKFSISRNLHSFHKAVHKAVCNAVCTSSRAQGRVHKQGCIWKVRFS